MALISLVEAFSAAARQQPQAALGHARAILTHAGPLGMSHESMRWGWPLAARAAYDLGGLREYSTPYHLAHGLVDHAAYLTRPKDADAAEAAISEARGIAGRLRCQPLLDRAAGLFPAETRIGAAMVTAPGSEDSAPAGEG